VLQGTDGKATLRRKTVWVKSVDCPHEAVLNKVLENQCSL